MKNINNEKINDEEFDLICKYIKLRNESNISQSELANRIGIARSTIARMERNLHSISLGTFTKLLEAMNFKLEIVPRSGLAIKHGITVLNTPGTVDAKLINITSSRHFKYSNIIYICIK